WNACCSRFSGELIVGSTGSGTSSRDQDRSQYSRVVRGLMASSRLVSIRVVGRQRVPAAPAVRSEEVSGPAAIAVTELGEHTELAGAARLRERFMRAGSTT